MSWSIKGDAGKTLNATSRTLESLLIENCTVRFASLAPDWMRWSSATENLAGGGTILPDIGQKVELFWLGVRKFAGHVTSVKVGLTRVTVEVSGPWWWLQNTPLSSNQADGSGTQSERVTFVNPTRNLAISIAALIDRAQALGCPITKGNIAAMYAIPKLTLADRDCATALAELMQWVPDATAWVDYSGALPKMHITRRGPATPLNLSAATSDIEDLEISPRTDLQVKWVSVKWVNRDTATGKTKWASRVNGTPVAGKRQIITVSGPEIADFLPRDDYDSVRLQTVLWSSISNDFVKSRDSGLAGISQTVGAVFGGVASSFTRYAWVATGTGTPSTKRAITTKVPGLRRNATNGGSFPAATNHLVISPTPLPEWAVRMLGGIPVTITGTWVAAWRDSERGVGVGWNDVFQAMQAGATTANNGLQYSDTTGPFKDYIIDWLARPFQVTGMLINRKFDALTTLHKPWDYDYIRPPADLEENLRIAQDWVPWEGTITQVADEVTAASNILGRAINVTDTVPACATMKAMLRGIQYEIQRGRTTYELGAPARSDFGSLVTRIRRDPQDNIVYL